jgi:hypothetical protein
MSFNQRNKLVWLLLFLVLIIYINGCVKEDFSVDKLDKSLDLKPALATPVGYFDFRLDEDLPNDNGVIFVNSDRLISLLYTGEVSTIPARLLFGFDPVSQVVSLPVSEVEEVIIISGSYDLQLSGEIPLVLSNSGDDALIDSVVISSGFLELSGIELFDQNSIAYIIIPGLKLNGNIYEAEITSGTNLIRQDISGYTLELTSEESINNLIEFQVIVTYPGNFYVIDESVPLLNFNFNLGIQQWERIHGFLGVENIDIGFLNVFTDLESTFPEGDFHFVEPELRIKTTNSFSIPLGMELTEISADTRESGNLILNGPGVPVPPDYFLPAFPDPGISFTETSDSLIIHSGNSNLNEIISSNPSEIDAQVGLLTNPGDIKQTNIIFPESKLSTRLELELPFHGSADSLLVRDTMNIDFSSLEFPKDDIIKNVIFKLYYENSFPADIELRLYLADINLQVTDTLFESTNINATPAVDLYVEFPAYVSGEVEDILPGERLQIVKNAKYFIAEVYISTKESDGNVKIFDNQHLFFNLGVIFDIHTNIEDF